METASFIKNLDGFTGSASLYELSRPIEYDKPWDEKNPPAKKTKFIIVSATIVFATGAETYIFPATSKGEIISWVELDGSYRGGLSHSKALANAGFTL